MRKGMRLPVKCVSAGPMSEGWLSLDRSRQNQLLCGPSVLANKQNKLVTSGLMQPQQSLSNPSILGPISPKTHMELYLQESERKNQATWNVAPCCFPWVSIVFHCGSTALFSLLMCSYSRGLRDFFRHNSDGKHLCPPLEVISPPVKPPLSHSGF